jgi:hypothetical protein
MSSKCAIHNIDTRTHINNGDIIISKNKNLYLVYLYRGKSCLVIIKKTLYQSPNYINIPKSISKHIEDPYNFYSILISPSLCPNVCHVSEIYLCKNKHKKFIKKYFSIDTRYRYTICYPYIYKICKEDNYIIHCKTII